MSKVKRIIAFILIGSLLIIVLNLKLYEVKDKNKKIYNEDTIIKNTNKYSYWNKEGICNENSGNIAFYFSGIDTLWELETNQDSILSLEYDSEIENGDFKVVLVTESNKISTFIEGTEKGSKDLELEKGINRIKIIGKKSKGKLNISFDAENLKSRPISYK